MASAGSAVQDDRTCEANWQSATPSAPKFYSGAIRPIGDYEQLSVGGAETREQTPMIGAMDGADASGAAAGGGNGNPDVAGGQRLLELMDVRSDWEKRRDAMSTPRPMDWSITGPGGEQTGPAVFPPSELSLIHI